MSDWLHSPYLLKEDVEATVAGTIRLLLESPLFAGVLPEQDRKDGNCHIIVLAPALWVGDPLASHMVEHRLVHEASFGDTAKWQHNFRGNALSKARQLAERRSSGGPFVMPHLLLPNDKPYWGGVSREGLIVACSGFDEHFDRMASGMIADITIARAHQRFLERKG